MRTVGLIIEDNPKVEIPKPKAETDNAKADNDADKDNSKKSDK